MSEDQSNIPPQPDDAPASGESYQGAPIIDSVAGGIPGIESIQPSGGAWQIPSPAKLQLSFAQYNILGILGFGGMGAVYKGWHKQLDRPVAIKVLSPHIEDDGINFAERFRQEAGAMAKFKHQGIVTVYDAGETPDGLLYFTMEYMEGTDLMQLVAKEGKLPISQALDITCRVCEALAYAHERGVIHRDIKPSNVMIEPDGTVKVADFGLAKFSGAEKHVTTGSGFSIGTPDFMPPEALLGSRHVDHSGDIYATGGLLYMMLTGKAPHGRFEQPSKLVGGLDTRLDVIVEKAMHADPAKRYASANELRAAIESVNRDILKRRAAIVRPLSRKNSLLVAGAAIAVFASIVALVHVAPWKMEGPVLASTVVTPSSATKDKPFVNSLGMQFVPVPGTQVLFSVWDTRVQDYAAYARVNKVDDSWTKQQKDGVPVSREMEYPVVGVSWEDAKAFCDWLTKNERASGKLPKELKYRLPTDEEWSNAVGLAKEEGATPAAKSQKNRVDVPWGKGWPPTKKTGNYADETFHAKFPNDWIDKGKDKPGIKDYNDGYPTTSPVGSFPANLYGLYDMGGNVWQWCEDWYDKDQEDRVLRGASWNNLDHGHLLSSYRQRIPPGRRNYSNGFRCVLSESAR